MEGKKRIKLDNSLKTIFCQTNANFCSTPMAISTLMRKVLPMRLVSSSKKNKTKIANERTPLQEMGGSRTHFVNCLFPVVSMAILATRLHHGVTVRQFTHCTLSGTLNGCESDRTGTIQKTCDIYSMLYLSSPSSKLQLI